MVDDAIMSQGSGAVWKSRWTSWAPIPDKPMVSVDVKQRFNQLLYVPALYALFFNKGNIQETKSLKICVCVCMFLFV